MDVSEAPTKQKKPRRWWKWLKRLLLAFALLLVLAVVFRGPLLRWIVTYGGQKGASIAGIELSWQVNGSILGDLQLINLKATGSLVETATIGELSAKYDSWRFLRTRDIDIVQSITLKDVNATLDLRKLTAETEEAAKPKKTPSDQPPQIVWPKTIDIDNVNFDLTLADGRRIVVRGFSLRVGEGMPGILRLAELRVDPDNVHVTDVDAKLAWGDRQMTLSGLKLPYGADLKRLDLDLSRFSEDAVNVGVEVALGKAIATIGARAEGLSKPPLKAVADVKLQNLGSADLAPLKILPPDIAFDAVNVDLHAEGPLNAKVGGQVKVSGIRAAGALVDEVVLPIQVAENRAVIESLRIVRGTNEINIKAQADLPNDVSQWQQITWKTQLAASLRDVPQLLEKPPPVQGVVVITADAEGLGAAARSVKGHVAGTGLGYEAYRLPQLDTDFALDGKEATLKIPALTLGEGNTIALNAAMTMEDTMPIRADWNIQITDPALLLKTANLPPLEQPVTAQVSLKGEASLSANAPLLANSKVDLSIENGRYDATPLPRVQVKVNTAAGQATVEQLQVVVDEKNRIDLTAKAKLEAPWTFDVNGSIALPELTKLNGLLKAVKAPAAESGAISAQIKLAGDAQPWRSEGSLSLDATKVKMAGMPQPADAGLRATFAGTTVELQKLHATLSPWRLLTQGTITDKEANLRELSIWQNERKLMSGHARAPFDIMQPDVPNGQPVDIEMHAKDLPVGEITKAAGVANVPPATLSLDITAKGRLETMDALVKIGVRDAKAPGVPKSFQPATSDITLLLQKNRASVDAVVTQAPLQPLTLKADMPLNLAQAAKNPDIIMATPIKATLRQPETDLGFLREYAPDTLRTLPAKMRLDVRVSGTPKAPLIDSDIFVDVPEVGFVSGDMPSVRDVRVRIRSHDRKIVFEDISALMAGGRLKLGGSIDAANLQDPRFDLQIRAQEALVFRNPTSSLRANADIAVNGTLKSARVSGLVEAVRGRVFQEVNLLPNVFNLIPQGEKLPPPPPSTSRTEQKLELPAIIKDWTFDLKVRTRDPILIAGNLVNGAISADIQAGGTGAAPRVTGAANVDRLLVKLPFSLLKITKGVVTMNPSNPFAPSLDVRGESRVGMYDITMYVYGDATDPKTRFTSSPPLSEADIVTLLGTGLTLGGDSSQLASEAATRAIFLVISETYRKIFNKKKTIRENPPKMHLTFNPSGADRTNDNVQATYEITPKVRFTGRFLQSGRVKALLGYVLRFGKAARAMDEEVPQ